MNKFWRNVLPRRIDDERVAPGFLRQGVASILNGIVVSTSLGKHHTDWTSISIHMPMDKRQLRVLLHRIADSKPQRTVISIGDRKQRAERTVSGIVDIADGAVHVVSLGHITCGFTMAWMCYGDDIVDWIAKRLP